MQVARYVKSDEEIAVLGRAAAGSDAGLQAAVAHLQAGVSDRDLWGQMVLAMLRADTDRPRLTRLALFPPDDVQELPNQPIGRSAQSGQVLFAEAGGLVLGYSARGMQPAALGSLAQEWRDAWQVWMNAWNETWEALRPGASLAEVRAAAQRASTARFRARPLVEGEGLGDDMPLITTGSAAFDRIQDRPLEPGVVVLVKPRVEWGGEAGHKEISWGDTVAITPDGPRRLGARPMEFIIRD
jgi:Xaa-Pro aminopeptidase